MFDRLIRVDLTRRRFSTSRLDAGILRKFIGGKGVGLSLLVEEDQSKDPLDPGNPLMFVTGPLTGTPLQTSGRSAVVTRSPLTGGFLDSHAGGHFGPALRRAGWDYLLITGASDEPVYLHVTPEGAEFLDACDLWGRDTFETEKTLWGRHEGCKVATIGPAGERLVRYASINTELYRQFGRGGAGAVMGSKSLKAVVASGNEPVELHDKATYTELSRKLVADLKEHPNAKRRYDVGTMMWIRMGQEIGHFLPTHNFRYGEFPDYEKITAETMKKELNWTSKGCWGCGVIMCSKLAKWEGKEVEGPEYETTAYLGSGCELNDAAAVAEANRLCDMLGLDTISAGVSISFAMECAERGLLPPEYSWIRFGSAEAVHRLIGMIARREGLGNTLAEGTRRASAKIGKGSDYFAIQTAGMELSGVNPLGSYSMGLGLATSDFASHTRLWTATAEMNNALKLETLPKAVVEGQDEVNARNSMIICDFLPYGFDRLTPFLNAATGFDYTPEEMMRVGARIQALSRVYTLERGRTHADDTLPARFFEEASQAGLMKGKRIPRDLFEKQVQEIFALRGWDEVGRPTVETLRAFGL
jgi:aldehyde:ferredoxin oxidoreductase